MSSVRYLRIYTGPDGQSHSSDDVFELETIGATLGKQVFESPLRPATECGVRVVPSGWIRDWGPADHPILAVSLTGEAELETSDGDSKRISPGLVLLVEDTTGPGHRVRVTSEGPVTVVQVHLPAG